MESTAEQARIDDVLFEIAPLADRLLAISPTEDGGWALGFEDDTIVFLELACEPVRIVLSSLVGKPPAEREAEVHATALSYASLWRESDGARIARGGDEGELQLVQEVPVSATPFEMLPALEHFSRAATFWREFVSREDAAVDHDHAGKFLAA
jgi:hypothetical protein